MPMQGIQAWHQQMQRLVAMGVSMQEASIQVSVGIHLVSQSGLRLNTHQWPAGRQQVVLQSSKCMLISVVGAPSRTTHNEELLLALYAPWLDLHSPHVPDLPRPHGHAPMRPMRPCTHISPCAAGRSSRKRRHPRSQQLHPDAGHSSAGEQGFSLGRICSTVRPIG